MVYISVLLLMNGCLFDRNSNFFGWIEGDEVWKKNGEYMGEIIDNAHILRKTTTAQRVRRAARVTPATPTTPAFRANRASRVLRVNYVDALDEFRL